MKNNKRSDRVSSKIIKRYFLILLGITLLYSLAVLILMQLSFTNNLLYNYVMTAFYVDDSAIIDGIYNTLRDVLLVTFYLFVVFIYTLIFFIRTSGYIDRGYDAFQGIFEKEHSVSSLPSVMKKRHALTEENINSAFEVRKNIADEAEKRKNDLVVFLAHDLKTPLTSVIGYLSLLKEAPELPVEYRAKYTNIALDKALRLEALINEFFDITRFNLQNITLERNHINLSVMLYQMTEEFYPALAEKGIKCNVTCAENLNIIADADKLSRVFDNIMRNAIAYCYENSVIYINAYLRDGYAVVAVKNSGDMIPREKLDMIFEKFFRADPSRTGKTGGAGLGLAIAKKITELHGGDIYAESDDYFTTFTVRLPEK